MHIVHQERHVLITNNHVIGFCMISFIVRRFTSTLSAQSAKTLELSKEAVAAHDYACAIKKHFYIDPGTGYRVMTEYAHQSRGTCCGNQCRHCPYNHINVKKDFQ